MTMATLKGTLYKNWTYLLISLSLSVLACQTTADQKPSETEKEEQILATQKEMVRNHLDSGAPEAALKLLRVLVREFPEDTDLLNLMGLTQLALHNAPKSVQFFRQAYKLDKQPATALNLSSAYIEVGSPEKAQALLAALLKNKAASKDYPYKERIYHNIGYSYVKLGNNKKAEQWFLAATEENPTFFPSHLELARLYEKMKRPAMAEKSYRRAIDFCRVCFEPVQALAGIQIKMGNSPEAQKTLVNFMKGEGVAAADRAQAEQMIRAAATASLERRPVR